MEILLITIILQLAIAVYRSEKIENLLKENLKEMKNLQTRIGTEPKE